MLGSVWLLTPSKTMGPVPTVNVVPAVSAIDPTCIVYAPGWIRPAAKVKGPFGIQRRSRIV